jgi:hypothetical protein
VHCLYKMIQLDVVHVTCHEGQRSLLTVFGGRLLGGEGLEPSRVNWQGYIKKDG